MKKKLPMASAPMISLWRKDQPSSAAYVSSIVRKNHSKGRLSQSNSVAFCSSDLAKRDDSIGSRVKATNSEMLTATEMVMPNCLKNCPTMPCTKATGKNTAMMV